MKIVIASTNPVKIEASRLGFERVFPDQEVEVLSVDVDSGVSVQPTTSQETFQGAFNRATKAKEEVTSADYWVGLEGGIELTQTHTQSFAWIVVISRMGMGKSRTASFTLPEEVNTLLHAGMELGVAMDHLDKRQNSKQAEGAVGILTGGIITRTDLYLPAVILAIKTLV